MYSKIQIRNLFVEHSLMTVIQQNYIEPEILY